MNGTQNLNLDTKTLEQCLKTVSHFGSNEIHNICNGQIDIIPWGGADWLGYAVLFAICISVALMFFGFAISILRGY